LTHILTELMSWVFLLGGCFFILAGALGLLRMPDIFTRLHAGGVVDTMGAGMVLVGLMFQTGFGLVTVKLALVLAFVWFSSPISTYALARAALKSGEEPYWNEDLEIPQSARIPGQLSPGAGRGKR
jgi:multicomponent Na+:H+ antiporter subunit G